MRDVRRFLACLAALVLIGCSDQGLGPKELNEDDSDLAPLYQATSGQAVPGAYIVVMKSGPSEVMATAAAAAVIVTPRYVYERAVAGFAATLDESQLKAVRRNRDVAFVEEDQLVFASIIRQKIVAGDNWGLDRIDQRNLPLNRRYRYEQRGSGVSAYIIDTGIMRHDEFKRSNGTSRAKKAFDAFGGNGTDCDGHGTFVAAIVGGNTYGVAKNVILRGVRVLDCDGAGPNSAIMAGIDFTIGDYLSRGKPAVANLSLGGGFSKAVNLAVDAMYIYGILPVVAAGNDDAYSCDVSPASALGAFTVAAHTKSDLKAGFSNWGRCVHLYAPGKNIISAWYLGGATTESGTSFAAPFATGVAALWLDYDPNFTPTDVANTIRSEASFGRITNNDPKSYQYGTPNLLLYKGKL